MEQTENNAAQSPETIALVKGAELLRERRITEAFDLLYPMAFTFPLAGMLLLRVFRADDKLRLLTSEQVAAVKAKSDEEIPMAKYMYARLLTVAPRHDDDLAMAFVLMQEAHEAGIADATYCLSRFYREGTIVDADSERADVLYDEALQGESMMAYTQLSLSRIYGSDGEKKNPLGEIDILCRTLDLTDEEEEAEADNDVASTSSYDNLIDPTWWHLLALAYQEAGKSKEAARFFKKAEANGY